MRRPYDGSDVDTLNRRLGSVSRVCDGVEAVRFAVRDELRLGAQFIKVMAAGGAASGAFPIRRLGYSKDELLTFVEEADKAQTYVCGHLYSDEAIRRAVELGFLSVEHATLIEPSTAKLLKEKDVIVTPTIIAYELQKTEEQALRLDPGFSSRLDHVIKKSPESLEILHKAGVKMAYGTDLLGFLHKYQGHEFVIRGRTLPAIDVIRSATCNAADLLRMKGKVGTVAVGAYADLIVVEKDPAERPHGARRGRPLHSARDEGRRLRQEPAQLSSAGPDRRPARPCSAAGRRIVDVSASSGLQLSSRSGLRFCLGLPRKEKMKGRRRAAIAGPVEAHANRRSCGSAASRSDEHHGRTGFPCDRERGAGVVEVIRRLHKNPSRCASVRVRERTAPALRSSTVFRQVLRRGSLRYGSTRFMTHGRPREAGCGCPPAHRRLVQRGRDYACVLIICQENAWIFIFRNLGGLLWR